MGISIGYKNPYIQGLWRFFPVCKTNGFYKR